MPARKTRRLRDFHLEFAKLIDAHDRAYSWAEKAVGYRQAGKVRQTKGAIGLIFLVLIVSAFFLTACTFFSTKMNSWVGKYMSDRLNIDLKYTRERIQFVENRPGIDPPGQDTYIEQIEKKCVVYWQVDSDGRIVSWRSDGSNCKYYNN